MLLCLFRARDTQCRKKSPPTMVFRRLEQYGIYWKYRRWRDRMVALCLAVSHFSLAICPGGCCPASLLVLRPNTACTPMEPTTPPPTMRSRLSTSRRPRAPAPPPAPPQRCLSREFPPLPLSSGSEDEAELTALSAPVRAPALHTANRHPA